MQLVDENVFSLDAPLPTLLKQALPDYPAFALARRHHRMARHGPGDRPGWPLYNSPMGPAFFKEGNDGARIPC
jgi:hypothetical protein